MANIPAKSDGDTLYAANLFKIAGYDNTGGNTSDTGDNTLSTINLAASALSQAMVIIAGIRGVNASLAGDETDSCTFKIKVAGVTKKTQVISMGRHSEGSAHTYMDGNSVNIICFIDASETWTDALAITVTGGTGASKLTAYVDWVIVMGV